MRLKWVVKNLKCVLFFVFFLIHLSDESTFHCTRAWTRFALTPAFLGVFERTL